MATLSWRHHTLIQALLSRGPLKEKDFQSIFTKITGKSPGNHQSLFNEYLRKINGELAFVQLELRACRNQYDGHVHYGVVNNVSDESSKLGTKYSVPQIAFYKGILKDDGKRGLAANFSWQFHRKEQKLLLLFLSKSELERRSTLQIEAIVQDAAAQGFISTIDALNIRLENQLLAGTESQSQGGSTHIPAAFRNFSMSQKERTLEELARDHWLSLTDGKIGLGVRSFLDLRSWFRSNEVPACEVCNEAAVKAELCKNEGCNVRIHMYCLRMKFSKSKAEKVCPGCGTSWHYNIAKVEALDEEEDASAPPESQQPREPSTRKRPRAHAVIDSDTLEPESSQSTRLTRRSVRLKSSG
ncbi:hypothetical protein RDI58_000165 [Solanum bulbocastanum]|uniref:Non-structural maintenance of chromosomes element 1 homolog n=1 Tax=Solanum bulbocastanum TaxID=147425 RepID=A0AAN8U9M5_SOLBU